MNLSKDLQDRLDNILLLMKEKQAPIKKKKKKEKMQKPIELIPKNPSNNENI